VLLLVLDTSRRTGYDRLPERRGEELWGTWGTLANRCQAASLGLSSQERQPMDSCDPCAFVYADVNAKALPERLASFGPRYRERLLPPRRPAAWHAMLRTRPTAGVWSALEYTCHVRDVFLTLRDRLYTVLVEDKPVVAPMYRDHRVILARYNEQDPEEAAEQLAAAARLIAQAFEALDPAQLARLCVYPFPAPTERPVLWVGQHAVHEGEHHLRDVESVIARVCSMG
jgi:hypothetical protein